ncbi:head maturation protease [Staphylococcus phage Stau2]|uniref:Putative prohead protease n=1 Tax=Staphylococcus phage Stau2 TaxID=1200862 RepID=A0A0U1ZYB1_9CAUD|nr:head maturation protease [Staphylococcus phage Stau2]AKA61275.1 putative prohead protease [Staphylococcus phage Stau2]
MKFNAFMDIDVFKSIGTSTENKGNIIIKGMASTGSLDLGNDIVDPKGIDISYFVDHGYVNDNHDKNKIIGYPTKNCSVTPEGLYVEAELFRDNENVQKYMELAENLEKSNSGRKIGMSIEGSVRARNKNDNRVIDSILITGLALTPNPMNTTATIDTVIKSFLTGTETTPDTQVDAGALRKESLASSITNLTYVTKIKDVKEYNDIWNNVVEDLTKSNNMGYEESVITLQLAKGLSRKDAEIAVMSINKKNLE